MTVRSYIPGPQVIQFEYRGTQIRIHDGWIVEACPCNPENRPTAKKCDKCGADPLITPATIYYFDNDLIGSTDPKNIQDAMAIAKKYVDRPINKNLGAPPPAAKPPEDDPDETDDDPPYDAPPPRSAGHAEDDLTKEMKRLGWLAKAQEILDEVNGQKAK